MAAGAPGPDDLPAAGVGQSRSRRVRRRRPGADRSADNRHIAFGAGPHRCLGSHLARQELRIGLTEWHARIPHYRLADGATVQEHGGQIGLDNLPLRWDL